ncbi:hypothetical protein Tco_0844222, partial [Tanacetum coccineum]
MNASLVSIERTSNSNEDEVLDVSSGSRSCVDNKNEAVSDTDSAIVETNSDTDHLAE